MAGHYHPGVSLQAQEVRCSYGRREVLRGVSHECVPGRVCAVVGPNAAGKTTLLRVLLGVVRPSAGRVMLDGVPVHRVSARDRASRVAYIPQQPTLSESLSVRQVVELGRYALGRSTEVCARAIEAVELQDRADEPFRVLSAGLQQRATLARALAQLDAFGEDAVPGKVLLADEPFAAMDPKHTVSTMGLFRRLARAGTSVVLVLHDLTTALRHADDALLLSGDGVVTASGPVETVLTPEHLERVFETGFVRLDGPGGAAIVPLEQGVREAPDTTGQRHYTQGTWAPAASGSNT